MPAPGKLAPDDTGEAGDKEDAQRQNDVVGTASHHADNDQSQQDTGKGGNGVTNSGQDHVGRTAIVAAQAANENTGQAADGHHADSNQKGRARPLEHPAEDIPAKVVGAQQMLQGGRLHLGGGVHLGRTVGGPNVPHQNEQRHHQRDAAADIEKGVPCFFHRNGPSQRSRMRGSTS